MGWDTALQAIGGGIEGAMSTYKMVQDYEQQDLDRKSREKVADQRATTQQIIQELRNAGMLRGIEARTEGQLQIVGARGDQAQDLERLRQDGRIDLSGINFGHDMAIENFRQGAVNQRHATDNATRRFGINTSASTARRGQDIGASTSRRGQDLNFGASTFATDSANRRALVPRNDRSGNLFQPGPVGPTPSYDSLFEEPPTIQDAAPAAAPPSNAQAEALRSQMATLAAQLKTAKGTQQATLRTQLAAIREQYRALTGR